jgi:hypothetical protein
MADDFGNLSGGDISTAYSAYKTVKRVQPFVQGTLDSVNSATTVLPLARAAGGVVAKRAAIGAGVELAEGLGARAAIGGLVEAGALGAGAGAALGALAGPVGLAAAVATPLVMQHMPMGVRKAVHSVPLIGSTLSPIHKKSGGSSAGTYTPPAAPGTVSGAQFAADNRAQYNAGRGFR